MARAQIGGGSHRRVSPVEGPLGPFQKILDVVVRQPWLEAQALCRASTRRRTPVLINAFTWAFTFSTPASAMTTGAASESVAARLASRSTATIGV